MLGEVSIRLGNDGPHLILDEIWVNRLGSHQKLDMSSLFTDRGESSKTM
jgi:hypothetical protein